MKKLLVWLGKAIPNSIFLAIGLLLYHFVYAAPAAPKCDCPCADKKQQASLVALGPNGQVTLIWPRKQNFLARTLHTKTEVQIDAAVVGTVDFDAPLTISVPNGPHKLVIKQKGGYFMDNIKSNETQITVSAQKPLYFQIIDDGINTAASELDTATALGLMSGTAAAIPSGTGTIYFYWPKPSLSIGFLDSMNTDLPVLLDGRRVGVLTVGDFVVVKAPSGEHVLQLDMTMMSGQRIKETLVLGGGSTRYFHIEKGAEYHIREDSPEDAAEFSKKALRQREVSAQ